MFGLGYAKVNEVVRTVNGWVQGQGPLRKDEAIAALRRMESKGHLALDEGMMYLPEAFYMIGRGGFERLMHIKEEASSP